MRSMLQGKNKKGLQLVSKPVEPVIPKVILDQMELFLDDVHNKCYKVTRQVYNLLKIFETRSSIFPQG